MKILILEDDAGSQHILRQLLEAEGHVCFIFDTPQTAIDAFDGIAPDVVLTDIHLPSAHGSDHVNSFCQKAYARVIVMTGYPTFELCQDVMNAGAQGFLVKPFKVKDFLELAENTSGQALSIEVAQLRSRLLVLEAELTQLKGIEHETGH